MDNRLDKFIELLMESLDSRGGGCQCGCVDFIHHAINMAQFKLTKWDEEQERINDQAFNDSFDNYGSGS